MTNFVPELSSGMNIVRAFECAGIASGFKLNIQGTLDDPLFQANQIGQLLGLKNVRDSIKGFDETQKGVVSTRTPGGSQHMLFLTELGLYRLLGMSRKPFARPFQDWVAQVVKEIRRTGKYEMEQRLDLAGKALEASGIEVETAKQLVKQRTEEHARELAALREEHVIAAKRTTHKALMLAYEDTPLVYLAEVSVLPDGRIVVKFGETDDIVKRENGLRRDYGSTVYFINVFVCMQPHKYEQWLKRQSLFAMHKYTGLIKGYQHEEVLAVTPAELKTVKRFMKNHLHMFDGWTAEQTLEKMRLQSEQMRLQSEQMRLQVLPDALKVLPDALKALSSITDPATRIDVEKAIAEAVRGLLHERAAPIQSSRTGRERSDASECDESDSDDGGVTELGSIRADEPPLVTAQPVIAEAELPLAEAAGAVAEAELPLAEAAGAVDEPSAAPHLFPPQPKRKMGRPPKAKVPPPTDADTPLQRFLDECFEVEPDAKTHVAHVRALHRLWRGTHVSRGETGKLVDFFKQRFAVVQEMDGGHDMTCSFYRGLRMRPWAPPHGGPDGPAAPDVDAFVLEACEPHVMGRARTADLWDAFVAWKAQQQQNDPFAPAARERDRFVSHLKRSFVYHTGVPVTKDGTGAPGFYGLYLNTATAECREVGYNRSPNTHATVLKLDAQGNVVATIDSQDVFAHSVAKKSPQHICKELTRCFKNGMKGVVLDDGYCYMRASDHAAMLAARIP